MEELLTRRVALGILASFIALMAALSCVIVSF